MPEPLDDQVRARMRSQRTAGTKPEIALRRILHRDGLRFRVDVRPDAGLRTRADIVFTRAKLAVYVDGCFWHGCPQHFIPPKNNAEWWAVKISKNVERDAASRQDLRELGWEVSSFWEHEDPDRVASAVRAIYLKRRH